MAKVPEVDENYGLSKRVVKVVSVVRSSKFEDVLRFLFWLLCVAAFDDGGWILCVCPV